MKPPNALCTFLSVTLIMALTHGVNPALSQTAAPPRNSVEVRALQHEGALIGLRAMVGEEAFGLYDQTPQKTRELKASTVEVKDSTLCNTT